MAKTLTDEDIKLNLIINGNQAQKELGTLEKETRKYTEANKQLTLEKKRLEQQGKKDSARYKELTAEIKANNLVIASNKEKMKQLQKQIGITGLTMKQLTDKAHLLKMSLINAVPGGEAYARYKAELTQVTARINELKGKAEIARWSLGSMADGFNRYQALALSFVAALTGVVLSIQKIIDINGKLSDAQSDVMKTTGMTKDEVDELTKSFGLLKTRTARIELLALATEAGRLGIEGVANVRAFVEQANKMKVALGDDLSDEAIREVGKLTNIYKVGEQVNKDFAGSMDALGSSINEVAASGANQAGFLVDYLGRQAGLVDITKLSADQNLGYAATFDELKQSVEVSATAMNKVWLDMFKNPEKFANITKMSINEFKDLMNKDANEAMIKFLEALRKTPGQASELLNSLDDIESGGTRGSQVILALANNTELLRKRQQTASTAIIEATSLTDEYNLKNNNLAATYEKIKKTITGWFSSETIISGLSDFFGWFAKLIGATEDLDGNVTRFKDRLIVFLKVLSILIVSFVSYQTALRLTALWTKTVTTAQAIYNMIANRGALATNLLKSAQILLASAYYAATGQIGKATAAMRLFNMVTKMNPIGLLLGLLAAAGTALVVFGRKTDEVKKAVSDLNTESKINNAIIAETSKTYAKESANLRSSVEPLISILNNSNLSLTTRKRAYEDLIKIAPEFRGTVDKEYLATENLNKVYQQLLVSMKEKLRFQAMQKVLKSAYDEEAKAVLKIADAEAKKNEVDRKHEEWKSKRRDSAVNVKLLMQSQEYYETIKQGEAELAKAQLNIAAVDSYRDKEINKLRATQKKYKEETQEWIELENKIRSILGLGEYVKGKPNTDNTDSPTNTNNGNSKNNLQEIQNQRLEQLRKNADEELKLRRELEDEILRNMDEGYQKEWQLEQTNWTRKIEDLQARLVKESEIELALKDANNSKLGAEQQKFRAQLAKEWIAQNKHIYGLIQTAEETKELKLKTIREKAGQQLIEKEKQVFDDAQIQREINHNLELAQLGTDEEAKKRLKEQYEKESLEAQEEFLNKQLGQLQAMLDGASIGGIDYSLLSPEAKEKLERDIKAVELAMARLKAAKNGETTDESTFGDAFKSTFGDSDVLGFTTEQWEQTYKNLDTLEGKLQMTNMVVTGLQNLWAQYNSFVEARENSQLRNYERNSDRKKNSLKRQLDSGLISQTQYNRAVETMDAQLDKKKAQLEYEQAKRQKRIAIFSAIIGTAQAVINAANTQPFFPLGLAMMALAGILGGLQIATISKQPLPAKGYEEGLYPMVKREQDGKLFKATGGVKPMRSGLYKRSTILVGEGPGDQPEMVIDKKTFARISPTVQDALLREIKGIKGFENGYYDKAGLMQVPAEPTTPTQGNDDYATLLNLVSQALMQNTEILQEIKREGLLAKVLANDYKSMENLKEGLEKYNELKSKARR